MYHDFFGFEQVPFSIAPDPDFLFLGPRHKEGLTHLHNGLTGSGGFLLLTGEVGTGKTTLCRAVLEQIGDTLDIAFVINPMLSERELLATICEQFHIPGRHEKASLKRLTDHLSRFLQEASKQGRQPVVLIDEAQHLLPSVLEQLRLLTNIETNSRKLLSVVLIGQPELQELLQRRELRQVAQRIVARYHLLPLTRQEMQEYIYHRLQYVGGSTDIFPPATMKAIWNFSAGTPRLINLLCDRALQLAARDEVRVVTQKHISVAIDSLSFTTTARTGKRNTIFPRVQVPLAAVFVLVFAVAAVSGGYWLYKPESKQPLPSVSSEKPADSPAGMPLHTAMNALAEEWQVGSFAAGPEPCVQLQDVDLACLRGNFSLSELRNFDVPSVIKGRQLIPNYYLLLAYDAQQENSWTVWDGAQLLAMTDAELSQLYGGQAVFLWQVPFSSNLASLVREGLAERVPSSLQERDIERQLQWLRQSQNVRVSDDVVATDLGAAELAVLSTAYFQSGPKLAGAYTNELSARTPVDYTVQYAGAASSMAELVVPQLSLTIPSSVFTDSAVAAQEVASEGVRISNPHQNVAENEVDAVSPRIRALFDDAVAEVGLPERNEPQASREQEPASSQPLRDIRHLTPAEKARLPRFTYNSHMYSGRTQERWIRLNDRMLREGDLVNGLRVIRIEPAHSIMGFGDILFRVEALEDFTE